MNISGNISENSVNNLTQLEIKQVKYVLVYNFIVFIYIHIHKPQGL
jgi:hypothetical protein